jgi:hypothetical protein
MFAFPPEPTTTKKNITSFMGLLSSVPLASLQFLDVVPSAFSWGPWSPF